MASFTDEESPATASLVAPMSLVVRERSSTVACSLSTCALILATAASKEGRTDSGMEDERPWSSCTNWRFWFTSDWAVASAPSAVPWA